MSGWTQHLRGKGTQRLLSLLGALCFAYVAFQVLRAPVPWHDLGRMGVTSLALVAGAQLLNDLLTPLQWRVLHQRLAPISWHTCLKVVLPNLYVNYLPLKGAIILVRMHAARREGIPLLDTAPSLFLLFFWRWAVVLALLPLLPLVIPGLGANIAIAAAAVLAVLLLGYALRSWLLARAVALTGRLLGSRLPHELRPKLDSLESRLSAILQSRAILIHTGIFLGVSLATTAAIARLFGEMGYVVSPLALLLALFASLGIGWLSHLPGGIGAQEATFAYLVSLLGVPLPVALAVALVWRLVAAAVDLAVSGGSALAFHLASRRQPSRGRDNHSDESQAAPRKLRVTLLGTLPPIKGISPYCLALAQALEDHVELEFLGFRRLYPDLLYPGGTRTAPPPQPLLRGRGTLVRNFLTYYNPLSWVWAGLTLRGDVVHAQWWSYVLAPPYAVILALARLRGRRCVLTVHNALPHEQGRLSRLLNAATLRFGSRFIVHNERSRDHLVRLLGIPEERIQVVPHGVLQPGPLRGTTRDEARRHLAIPLEAPTVLHFGNIRGYKGVDVLLQAMREVVQQQPQALLLLAGQPWGSWQPYADLIGELGLERNVRHLLRFIAAAEVEDYFAAADVVALPYRRFDSQSGVGAMALSFGRAMVVSDVGGLPDLVADRRAVVPPDDPHALTQALLRILGDPVLKRRLEADALSLAKRYQWADIAHQTVAVYRQAAAGAEERAAQVAEGQRRWG